MIKAVKINQKMPSGGVQTQAKEITES